jgi:hypothetical protein
MIVMNETLHFLGVTLKWLCSSIWSMPCNCVTAIDFYDCRGIICMSYTLMTRAMGVSCQLQKHDVEHRDTRISFPDIKHINM